MNDNTTTNCVTCHEPLMVIEVSKGAIKCSECLFRESVTSIRLEHNASCICVAWTAKGSLVEFMRCTYARVDDVVKSLKRLPHTKKVSVYVSIDVIENTEREGSYEC